MNKLIFVYNADNGLLNTLTDFAHKIISPSTYSCQLCTLTYGNFSVKKEWETFIKALPLNCEFYHRNEFLQKYRVDNLRLPAIYLESGNSLRLIISETRIKDFRTIEELMVNINNALKTVE